MPSVPHANSFLSSDHHRPLKALSAMRVTSLSVVSCLAWALGLACGALADPDYGALWRSSLTELAVANDADALLHLGTLDSLYVTVV